MVACRLTIERNPPTIHFTEATTTEAIRQVLDLARQGYIKYRPLSPFFDSEGIGNNQGAAIYSTLLTGDRFWGPAGPEERGTFKSVLFPRGSRFAVVAYDVGGGYISANAQNPEAWYRWL